MFLEKLLGVGIIIVSFTVLALISYFDPPTLVQIILAFIGSFVCLIGIVIAFAEHPIWIKERQGKTKMVPEAGRALRKTAL
jgi:hypothetical protein